VDCWISKKVVKNTSSTQTSMPPSWVGNKLFLSLPNVYWNIPLHLVKANIVGTPHPNCP
jgi:hypothetical protein